MSNLTDSFKSRQLWDILVVLFLLIIAMAFVPYGKLNLTYDSYDFMAASESVDIYVHGKNPEGFSYLTRSPLLPAYLYFFDNKILGAWWLNMLSLCGSILLIFKIGRALNLQDFLLYPSVIVTTMTYPWLLNHFFLWGDAPFAFLILGLTYCLIENKSFSLIVGMCVLLFLLRKAGIFFFVSASAWYLFNREYKNALRVMAIAFGVFISWQILEHSYQSTGTFLNMLNDRELYERIHYADALTSWVIPKSIPLYLRTLIAVLLMSVIAFIYKSVLPGFLKKRINQLLMTVALSYMICFIGFSGASGYLDAERYLTVVLPLCMLLLFSFAHEVHATGGIHATIFLVALMMWIIYPVSRTVYHLFRVYSTGQSNQILFYPLIINFLLMNLAIIFGTEFNFVFLCQNMI